jgi:hypothetical protein
VSGKPSTSFLGDCVIVPDPGDEIVVEAETK